MTEAQTRQAEIAMTARNNVEALRARIVQRYETLSPRLKQVAAYALEHPNDLGLETLAVIAKRCKVQPSTIVRFAKTFGYDGASDMQKLFRDELLSLAPSPSYAERIRQFNERAGDVADALGLRPAARVRAGQHRGAAAPRRDHAPRRTSSAASRLIAEAEAVYLVGLRRSFPVAAYLAYALRHTDKRTYLVDGLAGMIAEQSSMMGPGDLLIATSFRPYAQQTADIVNEAAERQGEGDRDQRQPAVADRAPRRPLLRGQGRGVPQVPLADGVALPRADARHQLRVPVDGPRRRQPAGMKTFALFGAGRIGRIHAANIAAHARRPPQVRRRRRRRGRRPRSRPPRGAAVADTKSALADAGVDALLVASPTDTHADLIEAGAAAGKAILCEKPVDLDVGRAHAPRRRRGARRHPARDRLQSPLRPLVPPHPPGHRRRRDRRRRIGADREPRPVAAAGRLREALGRPVPRHDDPRPRHGALAARRGAGRGHGPRQLPGRSRRSAPRATSTPRP